MKALVVVLSILSSTAAICAEPARKDVLKLAAKAADWQLAHLDGAYVTHQKEESREPKSWEQGAFYVGLTRRADEGIAVSLAACQGARIAAKKRQVRSEFLTKRHKFGLSQS